MGSASDDIQLLLLLLDGKMRERETFGIWILRDGVDVDVDVDVGGGDAFNSDEKDDEEKGEAKKALVFDADDETASLSARDEMDEQEDLVERWEEEWDERWDDV